MIFYQSEKGFSVVSELLIITLIAIIIVAVFNDYYGKIFYAYKLASTTIQINHEISRKPRPQLSPVYTRYDISPNNIEGDKYYKSVIIHNGDKLPLELKFDNTILEIDNITVATTSADTFEVKLDAKLNNTETNSMIIYCSKEPGPQSCHTDTDKLSIILGRNWSFEFKNTNRCEESEYDDIHEFFAPLSEDFDFSTGKWSYIEIGQLIYSGIFGGGPCLGPA